jgi:CHAT domain-containing protein
MTGQVTLNEDFTLGAFAFALASGHYQVVHIASHFVLNSRAPNDSFLLIGHNQKLTLPEIAKLDKDVDLLTLSACETAVGGNGSGQEFDSLAGLAEQGGAEAVLATLWPIVDDSTELFMKNFYGLRAKGLSKAAALQRAQLELLHNPKYSEFAHPRFWAPFILIGNPR